MARFEPPDMGAEVIDPILYCRQCVFSEHGRGIGDPEAVVVPVRCSIKERVVLGSHRRGAVFPAVFGQQQGALHQWQVRLVEIVEEARGDSVTRPHAILADHGVGLLRLQQGLDGQLVQASCEVAPAAFVSEHWVVEGMLSLGHVPERRES